MDKHQEKLIHALLMIPFVQRTEDRIESELNYQVWSLYQKGDRETSELDAATEAFVKASIPMPTKADVYAFYLDAVKGNLAANNPYGKPTLLEVCRAADEEMRILPHRGKYYEIIRNKIIQEIECADDICAVCGAIVEDPHWGTSYCSNYCWTRDDND